MQFGAGKGPVRMAEMELDDVLNKRHWKEF
jgi:hypothetical protein